MMMKWFLFTKKGKVCPQICTGIKIQKSKSQIGREKEKKTAARRTMLQLISVWSTGPPKYQTTK